MQYRTFGRLDFRPSALGFGAMRLPILNDDPAQIDEPEAIRMIRRAIDGGVNYVDTAYPYHSGTSEGVVGRALKDGYREKVKVATKAPTWLLEKTEDFDRYLDEQLQRLDIDHIDFYLIHALARDRWAKMKEINVFAAAEKALADGRIRHLGFSFHDGFDVFKEIVDYYDNWEFCQIQYNYMDTEHQAGTKGLRYAADKGLGVVIMEPIHGGALANLPNEVVSIFERARARRTPVDWALQWIWDQSEVSLVLSGMSTMRQVEENLASADRSGMGSLTAEDRVVIEQARQAILGVGWVPCTACAYCSPCPHGVDIPQNFIMFNDAVASADKLPRSRRFYSRHAEEKRAGSCQECGECEDKCPQHLPIRDLLKKVHELLWDPAAAADKPQA